MSNTAVAASIHFTQLCIQWSSLALIYYDYALTFGAEVRYIWGQKFRKSTILYYCCRYALVANLTYLLTITNKIRAKSLLSCNFSEAVAKFSTSCHAGYIVSSAFSVPGRLAVVVVWIARTFAVSGRNIWVLIFFSAIGLMITILDIEILLLQLSGLLAIMMVVFEILATSLTTFRVFQALNFSNPWKQHMSLHYLLLEHGVLYFFVVTVLTIANLALNIALSSGFLQRLLNAYTIPLSGLLTARFMLRLREWEANQMKLKSIGDLDVGGMAKESSLVSAGNFHSDGLDKRIDGHIETSAISHSFIDEFGKDMVQRAQAQASYRSGILRDEIVEELRE